jgi:pimeloyl-ACP methyl ester carboxylesterase
VHGVFLNGHLWRHVIDGVSDLRRCIAIDLLGHGATRIADDQDILFGAQAAMLEAVCEGLGLDHVDVVANDSGGGIAQVFAAEHPERIRSLTLTNCDVHDNWPPASLQPLLKAVQDGELASIGRRALVDERFARRFLGVGFQHPEGVSMETLQAYLRPVFSTRQAIRHLERFLTGLDHQVTVAAEPGLKRLQAPTLVVWATADIFFPVRWAYWLRDTIPGCNEVVEVPGAKLFFPDERPQELVAALRRLWFA